MPDPPAPKERAHPSVAAARGRTDRASPGDANSSRAPRPPAGHAGYVELATTSNFTFLCGASHPDELVAQAAALGYTAIGLTDHNTLGGIVRAHVAARAADLQLIVGCRLVLAEPAWLSLLVYPTSRPAYGVLCQLLTLGKRRAAKGGCHLMLRDLEQLGTGLLAIAMLPEPLPADAGRAMDRLKDIFDDDRLSVALVRLRNGQPPAHEAAVRTLAARHHVPLVALNDVYYHVPQRRPLQDVLTCIRHGCTLDEAGLTLLSNAERHLKPPEEMHRLFADDPAALARSVALAERCRDFSLDALRYEYPDEVCPPGLTPMQHLRQLTLAGATQRYPAGVPQRVLTQLEHEFPLIEQLAYAPYFLTVHDLVSFARARNILCQGRGAAANSAVCYCLGVTSVDPARIDVLFERFVSREREEPPDIDIDFEHERREEVIQYIYAKYGRERAALTAEIITYRAPSAIRDVGKALGLSLDAVDQLARQFHGWEGAALHQRADDDDPTPDRERAADMPGVRYDAAALLREAGYDPDSPVLRRLIALGGEVLGFPRHRSQHVGGFIITRGPLCECVPIENAAMPDRTVIEWDKDDIEAMGMLKVDVLGLGMLTCLRKGFDLLRQHHGRDVTLATVPAEDPAVYDLICKADTLGVFQIESRAQMSMLPRLKPRCFYDLVIEVAIVRPGPIVGDMVHPYLRRRNGEEPVHYPDERVRKVLEKTLGIPLFQEQAMSLAIVAAGFSPGEAEMLRRAISAWKSRGKDAIPRYQRRFLEGMLQHGYTREFAEQCFNRLKGFSEYGFPESHAASFALLVYASAWLKRYYPAAFAAALLNSQPMGFYAPAQIVHDARDHGVEVRAVDVNHSRWDCTLERDGRALRLGLRRIKGLKQRDADALSAAVARAGGFASLEALWRASGVSAAVLRTLARADAFRSLGLDRQHALWAVQALPDRPLPLFDQAAAAGEGATSESASSTPDAPCDLPPMDPLHDVVRDYETTGLSLKSHPVAFLRPHLERRGVLTAANLRDERRCPHGCRAAVAGVVLCRQRPGTARGVLFMTLEDETGRADLIVRPHIYTTYRRLALHAGLVIARGRVERQGLVVHMLVARFEEAGVPAKGVRKTD